MALTIDRPDLEILIRVHAQAEGLSVDDYLEQLILEHEKWRELSAAELEEDSPEEAAEVQAARAESRLQVRRGETIPWEQAKAELLKKHGFAG